MVLRHGVRSAITPIVTVLGLDIGILLGGAILTETVFNIPGIGRLTFDAIQRGDLTTVQGTTLFLACAVCLMNLFVDILYAFLDPRVRYCMPSRCSRSRTSRSTSTPTTASSRPSTASPTPSAPGGRSGSWASRARASPSPRSP